MIKDSITEGKQIETTDNTLCDLKRFIKDCLYCHFYKHKDCEVVRPGSYQPGIFFFFLLRFLKLKF